MQANVPSSRRPMGIIACGCPVCRRPRWNRYPLYRARHWLLAGLAAGLTAIALWEVLQ